MLYSNKVEFVDLVPTNVENVCSYCLLCIELSVDGVKLAADKLPAKQFVVC